MKLSFAVLATTAATASAGVCCCAQKAAGHSTSLQCGPSGDIPFAVVVKQYSDDTNCNGKHTTGNPVPVANCSTVGVVGDKDSCLATEDFGVGACTWNSASSTAVTMAAVAAAVVAYVV